MCSSNKHYLLKWFFGNQVLFKNVRYCTSVMFSKFFFYYYYLMYTTVQMFAVHEKIFNDGIYFSVIVVCELNWKAFFCSMQKWYLCCFCSIRQFYWNLTVDFPSRITDSFSHPFYVNVICLMCYFKLKWHLNSIHNYK